MRVCVWYTHVAPLIIAVVVMILFTHNTVVCDLKPIALVLLLKEIQHIHLYKMSVLNDTIQ